MKGQDLTIFSNISDIRCDFSPFGNIGLPRFVFGDTLLEQLSQARPIYRVNKGQLLVIDSVSYGITRFVETLSMLKT